MIRYTDEQIRLIKNNLEKILIYYGAEPDKPNWKCIEYRHNNPKSNLSVNGNICCCHCGIKGDSFSVIAIIEGFDIKRNFPEIIKRGLEILGNNTIPVNRNRIEKQKKKEDKIDKIELINKYDLTKIILQNFNKSKSYIYFKKRNIRNLELLKKYRIFTGNPIKILPEELLPQVYNLWSYQNIIPVWENKVVKNVILRRDDYLSTKNKKILNLKHLDLKIWNAGYIRHSKFKDYLFLTEGIFDALSVESIGYKAIALNSITMIDRLLKLINEFIDQLKENQIKFVICFDNDKRKHPDKPTNSEKARNRLDQELRELGFETFIIKLNSYKDLNDFYKKDSFKFANKLNNLFNL